MAGKTKLKICLAAMQAEQIEAVHAIEKLSFSTPWPKISFFNELQNDLAFYLVALAGRAKKAAGYAGMWLILDEAHLTNLAVHPDYRRLGIGRTLMEEMIFRAVFLGAVRMTLEVRVSNRPAIALYESLGFRREGRRKGYYEDTGEDALIMWKEFL